MTLTDTLQWLQSTRVAELVTQSLYGFQIVVGLHLLGLGLSVGLLVWVDLRLLGKVMRDVPASEVYRRLAPWMLAGFVVMFVSGGLLFVGYANAAYENMWFRIKVAALGMAAVNAALYHLITERRVQQWEAKPTPPIGARIAGLVSIAIWMVVVFAGRMMSYTMF